MDDLLQKFREQGQILYKDPNGEFEIHSGDIYEAKTVKGHTNLIIPLRRYEGYILYAHGDKVKKVRDIEFIRSVESGDLTFRFIDEIDKERLSMSVIMLDAIANRRTFEESVDVMADGAEEYQRKMFMGG